jgi:hypothetical protein
MWPTPAYHEWIATETPVQAWTRRLQGAGYDYADRAPFAFLAPVFAADAADRLREIADQAAHQLALGNPEPDAVPRLRRAAETIGRALVELREVHDAPVRFRAACRSYIAARAALDDGLRHCLPF